MTKGITETLAEALRGLATPYFDRWCFCEMRNDNPGMKGHTSACDKANTALERCGMSMALKSKGFNFDETLAKAHEVMQKALAEPYA